jgi:hypothetical protein
MVELLEKATRRLVQQENRQAHSTEPAAPCPAAEEQTLAQAILRQVTLPQALLALAE